MSARLDLFFQGYTRAPVTHPKGRLDLFFQGATRAPGDIPKGRLDLFFTGGAGYPGPIIPPEEGGVAPYQPQWRQRRR